MAALSRRRLTKRRRKGVGGQEGIGKSREEGIEDRKEERGKTCSLVMMTNQRPPGPVASPQLATGKRELSSFIWETHTLSSGSFAPMRELWNLVLP